MRLKKGLIAGFFAGIVRVILNLLKYKMFKDYYILPSSSGHQLDGNPTRWLVQTGITDLIVGILFGLLYGLLVNSLPGKGLKKGLGYGFVIWIISEWPSLLIACMTGMIDWILIVLWGIGGLITSLVIGVGIVFIYDAVLKKENPKHEIRNTKQ
ncbi:MAG: hypothetical protein ABIF11_08720 [Nitrospirota bacterium]